MCYTNNNLASFYDQGFETIKQEMLMIDETEEINLQLLKASESLDKKSKHRK